jgi:hypothetical protein
MCTKIASLSVAPSEVMNLFIMDIDADLIYKQSFKLYEEKEIVYMVFEKNKLRDEKVETLCINIENMRGITTATIIISPEITYDRDCIKEDWLESIMDIIKDYIIELWEE